MGSPETCPTCESDRPEAEWYIDAAYMGGAKRFFVKHGVARDGWHLCPDAFHATPTTPAPTDVDPDAPIKCGTFGGVTIPPHIRARMDADRDAAEATAPADARPMVVGGAFVKFDRPAPAPDAGAAERARRIEEALRKIANYAGPIVCEHYETCRHEACDFAYFAQTLAADTLNGTTTEIGDAAEAERAGRRGTNQAKRGNDARKGGEGA